MRIYAHIMLPLAGVAMAGALLAQSSPDWWINQSVVPAQAPAAPNAAGYDQTTYDAWMALNYAAANLGQAKNVALQAFNAMDTAQAGSAGTTIEDMVTAFSTAPEDNYVPLTVGQLKALSAPFYDIMHAEDYPIVLADDTLVAKNAYPWIQDVTPDNLAIANLGQLKHVFSFDLSGWPVDSDDDELPDSWELALIGSANSEFYDPDGLISEISDLLGVQPDNSNSQIPQVYWDYDGDGVDNLTEYNNGTDAADYFNGEDAYLEIRSGNNQSASPESFVEWFLLVAVKNQHGARYEGAPVIFETTGHLGLCAFKDTSLLSDTRLARTDKVGALSNYYTPTTAGNYTVTARLPGGQSVTFNLASYTPPGADVPEILNFTSVDNEDGTTTYTWSADVSIGQWFQLSDTDSNGQRVVIYQSLYGSPDLPVIPGGGLQTYSVTLDGENQ